MFIFVNYYSTVSQVFDIKIYRISIGSGQTKVNRRSADARKRTTAIHKKRYFLVPINRFTKLTATGRERSKQSTSNARQPPTN